MFEHFGQLQQQCCIFHGPRLKLHFRAALQRSDCNWVSSPHLPPVPLHLLFTPTDVSLTLRSPCSPSSRQPPSLKSSPGEVKSLLMLDDKAVMLKGEQIKGDKWESVRLPDLQDKPRISQRSEQNHALSLSKVIVICV